MPIKPRVVWALQAPTLLQQLSRATNWQLEVADFGDAAGLQEVQRSSLRQWDGRAEGVTHVVCCTTLHWRRARRVLPKARLVWALHCAKRGCLPAPEVSLSEPQLPLLLAFSHRVAWFFEALYGGVERDVHVLVPCYVPLPTWRHRPDVAWALVNRPKTRPPLRVTRVKRVVRQSGVGFSLYGQDTERGFLGDAALRELWASSTAYVSALPKYAGFGLSEHECLSRGVPVVGTPWGDMPLEMPLEYGFSWELESLSAHLARLSAEPKAAQAVSEIGLQFIRDHRTVRRTELGIEALIDARC